ncbi:hypothetical protein PR202_gb13610 [Eleusine coracana subsp. coracana]|uniref:NB-ARC domain-containing protein n=1 Tax=Eleusine coracana subsp. coracana TaxID=191504 RepID=A0AAV5ESG6_ELECO|nr:hypothetical protein PR202_gb13610 [Eleusine coracana subsp. coracana]
MGGEVYKIQPLSDDNSRKLFYARIYGDEMRSIEYQLDETTNKILKKCAGIPLAIITMASLLVGKPKEIWCDVITSIGFGHEVNEQVENTKKILSYSYYDMPSYLRTCLLYLSVFPEDHTISKTFLIWRWIAEGLIQGKPGICLFKLGEQCFNDLINRSMVQGVESEYDGLVRSCHVHDMVLDLIRSISTQENFVTILDNGDESSVSPPPSGGARRLALHANAMVHTAHQGKMMKMTQVRSFITISCSFGNQVPLSSFKVLRVLDMCDCEDLKPSYLVHLDNLVHLRYLRLDSTSIDDLPNEIGALKHLQTLILCDTEIRKLTPSISQLTQLVCLNCDYLGTLAPNWIGKLTSLEELEVSIYFTNKDEEDHARGFLKELGSLKELRVFRSRLYKMDTSMQIDLALSLSKLHKLQKLDLWCSSFERFYNAIWGQAGFVLSQHLQVLTLRSFMFPCMPSCISAACLPNLISLHLEVDTDEKGLEFLGRLPELCHLYLATDSTVTISNFSAHSYFRKLRFFYLPVSMIQFQLKEEDSTVSFHIWNGTNAMPFGSSKKDSNVAPYAVMPSLEKLFSRIDVRALKDVKGYFSNIGLEYLPSLRKVEVEINVSADDVEVAEAEAALTKTTEVHPNHPTLKVHK